MKLTELAKQPRLVQVIIDDEDIVKEFGETIEFYTWDRQPMDVFLKLSAVDVNNPGTIISTVRELILDETGAQVLKPDVGLPPKVMMRVITKVVESLGK